MAWAVAERRTTATTRRVPPQRGQDRATPAGSILGLRVAECVAAGRPLTDVTRLSGPALRQAIETALSALEKPGA
jgi:hypothetical protein